MYQEMFDISIHFFRRKQMYQNGYRCFRTSEKEEMRRPLYLIAAFSKTLFEQSEVRAMAIHHNDLSHKHRAFLNGDAFVLRTGSVKSSLVFCHQLLLEHPAGCWYTD